jgi:hypothetical protein
MLIIQATGVWNSNTFSVAPSRVKDHSKNALFHYGPPKSFYSIRVSLTQAMRLFNEKMYKRMTELEDGNIVYSPYRYLMGLLTG